MDIIESPRSKPRARLVSFLLAATLVMGVAIWVSTHGARSGPPPSTLETPAASPSTYGFLPLFPQGPPPPVGLASLVAPGKPPRAVDPAHGTSAAIIGISDTPQGKYAVTEVGEGYVVTVRVANPLGTGPEPPTDAYLVTGDLHNARQIATGTSIAVGVDGRSVLVAAGPRVTRRGLDGTKQEEVTLPADQTLVVETVAGFLIAAAPVGPWEVWDPRTGEIRHRFPQLFAATSTTVAYGTFSRAIIVLDLATGAELETEIPDRELTVYQAALSRDGRYLATQLINRGQWQHLIAVFDTKLRLWVAMPGSPFAALNQMALAWSGSTLVLARTDQPAVTLWTPGDAEVYSAQIT